MPVRRFSVIGSAATAFLFVTAACRVSTETVAYQRWDVYHGDPAGTKYSTLDQIHLGNVQDLRPVWTFRSGDKRENPPSTIECNPIVVNGVMYLTSPGLKVFALEADTGAEIWRYDPFPDGKPSGVNRGVTYWEDGDQKRIFFVAGSHLTALDVLSGGVATEFGEDGRVDLREGLDRAVDKFPVTATSPGIVFEDLLILGSVVGEGPGPAAPGHVRAFDVRTGARVWIFHTIPQPGEFGYETWPPEAWKTAGGANAWGGFTLDEGRGLVFFGTGSPSYDHYGGNRAGQNLFGNSILALDARTGRRVWHFQTVHHDLWDYDLPCPPNLVTVRHDGKEIAAVAQASKMGHLFLLDRETGQPLFPVEERPVPQSDVPGERSWPTQPFPVRPPAYAKQTFSEDDVTNRTPEVREFVLEKFRKYRSGSLFLPPSLQGTLTLPQFNGGTDWGGAAFDPEAGILYVNASNDPELIRMVQAGPAGQESLYEAGERLFLAHCSTCHVSGGAGVSADALQKLAAPRAKTEILATIENGQGQMPSFSALPAVEKEAMVAFLVGGGRDRSFQEPIEDHWSEEIPYVAVGHEPFLDQEGYPAIQPPWGTLSAIDLNRGEILWQVPLGGYPALASQGLPDTGTFNMGGPVVTRGGLVFIGGARDEKFRAYNKETGELVWEWQMEAGGYATPATYEVDGRQYVIIAAGGGGKPETRAGDAYYCFALPK